MIPTEKERVKGINHMALKKKQEVEHDNSERWLLTYSDLITLLMIFFVIMYAMSNVDAQKYQVLSESLVGTLNPVVSAESGGVPGNITAEDLADILADGLTGNADPALIVAAQEIQTLIDEKGLQDKVSVSIQERGVVVSLMNTVLFDPGSTQVKEDSRPTLIAIGEIANGLQNYIRIEGNTDDIPQNSEKYPSNWELSLMRAAEVLQIMITESGVSPAHISAIGYGEHRPTVPNTSAENRARNRKVDIVILNDQLDKSEAMQFGSDDGKVTISDKNKRQ